MNWYYAVGQDQKGPVTEEQLQALVKDGVVTGDTLVWREGLANWQAYRTLAAPGTLPGASPMTSTTASASATVGTDSPRTLTESEFFATDYAVRIGENLSRAWRAFTGHAGVMIGSGLLVMFIIMVVSVIPFLGGIIGIFINGPLIAGMYALYLRCLREEPVGVGNAFAGFGPQYMQLVLGNLVVGLLSGLSMLPGIMVLVFGGVLGALMKKGGGLAAVSGGVIILGGGLFLVGALIAMYLALSWCMTLILIIDKRVDFWPAMGYSRRRVGRHIIGVFFFMLVVSILSMLGVLALVVGLFITMPVAFAMLASLYEEMFRDFHPSVRG